MESQAAKSTNDYGLYALAALEIRKRKDKNKDSKARKGQGYQKILNQKNVFEKIVEKQVARGF